MRTSDELVDTKTTTFNFTYVMEAFLFEITDLKNSVFSVRVSN